MTVPGALARVELRDLLPAAAGALPDVREHAVPRRDHGDIAVKIQRSAQTIPRQAVVRRQSALRDGLRGCRVQQKHGGERRKPAEANRHDGSLP